MRETNEKSILFKAITMPDSDKKISYMTSYLLKLGYKDLALRYLENEKSGK